MATLHDQRAELVEENTELMLKWLAKLDPNERRYVIRSMVKRYSLPKLKTMNRHVKEQLDESITN